MMEMIEANWPLLLVAFLIGLAIAWFAFNAARRTKIASARRDVLDEGAAPAARNQALIDGGAAPAAAPPSALDVPPATPMGLAGAGAIVAATVHEARQDRLSEPGGAELDSAAGATADDLTRIKGVGPRLAAALADLGVVSLAQIAAWDDAQIDRIDARLGRFQGRIRRDDWVAQARLLASGDTAAYEARYGRTD